MKKLFLFDIDGTLTINQQIPQYNIDMLRKLKELGHLTFICTGRPLSYVDPLFKGLVDGYILNNGRMIYYNHQIIFNYPLTADEINKYVSICQSIGADYTFISDQLCYPNLNRTRKFMDPYEKFHIKDYNLNKINVYALDIFYENDAMFKQLQNAFSSFLILNDHKGHYSADVTTPYFTKGDGILKLKEYLNTPVITYAFGDGTNDLGMFKVADYKIAMGNAHPDLKQEATFVTKDCNDQGIIYALQHLNIIDTLK